MFFFYSDATCEVYLPLVDSAFSSIENVFVTISCEEIPCQYFFSRSNAAHNMVFSTLELLLSAIFSSKLLTFRVAFSTDLCSESSYKK
jgi:hypothetical protein